MCERGTCSAYFELTLACKGKSVCRTDDRACCNYDTRGGEESQCDEDIRCEDPRGGERGRGDDVRTGEGAPQWRSPPIFPPSAFPPRYATATAASKRPVTFVDVPYVSMKSTPLNASVPAHADIASSSPSAQLLAPGSRSSAGSEAAPATCLGGRLANTKPAVTIAAGRGTARNANRQDDPATRPITGIPATHAAGAPASACATTRPRASDVLQMPAAPTPPATSPATPIQRGNCPSASARNEGAAALATEPTATSSVLPSKIPFRGAAPPNRARSTATSAATGAAKIRN